MDALHDHILRRLPGSGPAEAVVVRPGGLGDTLLVLPTLGLLADALPGGRLTLVGSAWAEQLLPLLRTEFRVVRFDSPELTPLFAPGAPEVSAGVFRSAHLAVVYADRDDAFVANVRRLCPGATVVWPVRPDGVHASVHFVRAVACVDCAPHAALHVPADADAWAAGMLTAALGPGAAPVAVHPGSGGRHKCWSVNHFADLIDELAAPVLLLCGPADAEPYGRLLATVGHRAGVVAASGLPLVQAAALLARCRAYVGNDSGLTHLAAALAVPTAAVFGPTDPAIWAPRGPAVQVAGGNGTWPSVDAVRAALAVLDANS